MCLYCAGYNYGKCTFCGEIFEYKWEVMDRISYMCIHCNELIIYCPKHSHHPYHELNCLKCGSVYTDCKCKVYEDDENNNCGRCHRWDGDYNFCLPYDNVKDIADIYICENCYEEPNMPEKLDVLPDELIEEIKSFLPKQYFRVYKKLIL